MHVLRNDVTLLKNIPSIVCCRLMGTKKAKVKKKQASSNKILKDIEFEDDDDSPVSLGDLKTEMERVVTSLADKLTTKVTTRFSARALHDIDVTLKPGERAKLFEIAEVNTDGEEFRIVVVTGDKKAAAAIVRALQDSGLGLNPRQDGRMEVLLPMPLSTNERRAQLAHLARQLVVEGKEGVRRARNSASTTLQKQKKLPQDDKRTYENKIQQLHDHFLGKLDQLLVEKEQELASDKL